MKYKNAIIHMLSNTKIIGINRYNDPERAVLPLYLSYFGENVLDSQNRPFSLSKLEKLLI